ncbi:MAG: dicarboxylate/amino acid:cation symporter [Planctomycetota bacterium]|jgi:Na+/H+-dicarboxylate symporter|nr:dicarboxylate/amino acid:cation symporter [Planctomycetota bacterium]
MAEQVGFKGDYGLIVKLIIGILIGIVIGLAAPGASWGGGAMQVIGSIQYFSGQIIFYVVPFVVLAFIAPAIVRVGENASKMLIAAVALCYFSSVAAACFSWAGGTVLFPFLHIASKGESGIALPDLLFKFDIPPMMSVMTALVTAIFFGLAMLWSKSKTLASIWDEFERCVLVIVQKILIPLLPFFVASTFAQLAYEGLLTRQLPVFVKIIVLAILGQFCWMFILYAIAGAVSKRNPWQVVKFYGPAYLTAIGTMSSAATLPVSLRCAHRSPVLSKETVDFMIPLGATMHLCGSVLTETLFVMIISHILYGAVPAVGTMILFIILFGFFAVGAPGVPGGTVMASLGIVVSVLGFDPSGTALLIAIFAIQDSFGTACNVTSDGALALIIEGIFGKKKETA